MTTPRSSPASTEFSETNPHSTTAATVVEAENPHQGDLLLTEDGNPLAQEDGTFILLEGVTAEIASFSNPHE